MKIADLLSLSCHVPVHEYCRKNSSRCRNAAQAKRSFSLRLVRTNGEILLMLYLIDVVLQFFTSFRSSFRWNVPGVFQATFNEQNAALDRFNPTQSVPHPPGS